MTSYEKIKSFIVSKCQESKIGIIFKGLNIEDPVTLAHDICSQIAGKQYFAFVGYGVTTEIDNPNLCLSKHIEKAVYWRNEPACAGNIVVFVKTESDKMHSLADFDHFSVSDVTKYFLQIQADKATNIPEKDFWKALNEASDFYSLEVIRQFIEAVENCENQSTAIPENMWILNLLPDDSILGANINQSERLKRNRDLILAIGQLSEESRKKLSRSLASKSYSTKTDLQKAYQALQKYYKYGNRDTLKGMNLALVESLFAASKEKPKKPKPSKPEDEKPVEEPNAPLRTKELNPIISDILVTGDESELEDLNKLLGELERHYEPTEEPSDISAIGGTFGDRQVVPDECKSELRKLLGQVCHSKAWGALMTTEETVLKDIISSDYEIEPLQPLEKNSMISYPTALEGMVPLFDFIKKYDAIFEEKRITSTEKLTPVVDKLISLREEISKHLDMILLYPTLLFGANKEARKTLVDYIEAWAKLYHCLSTNDPFMREISPQSTTFISQAVLSLDILYIKTPKEWKAMLLPLHPLYLWRYYEVFKDFDKQRKELTEDDQEALKNVLTKLPQILSFVIVNGIITKTHENKVLPCSGNYEMLPTFENKTNRYLGRDGTESIREIFSRWLGFAPYTKNEVRVCVVDAPDLLTVIRDIKKSMDEYSVERVVLLAYLTRGQNGNNDLSQLDYSGKDYEIAEFIRNERISISIINKESVAEVKEALTEKPVHLAFYFDQSSYSITYGPSDKDLYINPLVITYDYNFDTMEQRGTIFPSCEMNSGLIGDYHRLMRSADMVTNDQSPRPAYNRSQDVSAVVSTIQGNQTQWLIAADRDTNNYDPQGAIPIGEVQYDKRMVNIWASTESRIVIDYKKLLRGYNLFPDNETLTKLLKDYGHIAGSGLISIPKSGADEIAITNKKKGLIGTLFAASWYNKKYPNSLVASLDDERARIWLHDSKYGNDRADLIGLYYDEESNVLRIQPIEVKTRDDTPDASYSRDPSNSKKWILEGHAADQISSIVAMLNDIFTSEDATDMFVSARREVLKFQIVTECFRNIHSVKWQEEWCSILKQAFKSPSTRPLKIEISGILAHIKLSESAPGKELECTNAGNTIWFELLTASDIQKVIFGQETPRTAEITPDFDEENSTEEEEALIDPDMPEDITIIEETKTEDAEMEKPQIQIFDDDSSKKQEEAQQSKPVQQEETPKVSQQEIAQLISDFRRSCQDYHINLKQCGQEVVIGPSVIRISFTLARGQSANAFTSHIEDISREMRRSGVIISRKSLDSDEMLLDVPRLQREKVLFKDVVNKLPTITSPEQLYFTLGRTPNGTDIIKNLAELPHLLVGGSTGSGKSVFLFTILASLLKTHPKKEDMLLVLSSSKLEDFIYFEGLPHLYSGNIISDAAEATRVIKEMIALESDERGKTLARARTANIIEYNKKAEQKMRPIVVIIDEFADLADQFDKKQEREEFYKQVQRIAQTGRSRGIHLIVCTQRPEAKIVPPTTKAQLPARVALRVPDQISSRMIIDSPDAQYLQKHGDMIFRYADEIERAQGYLIETSELDELVQQIIEINKDQN